MSRLIPIASAFGVAGMLVCGTAEAVQRSFVASYGSDANVAANCTFASPCRSFQAAHGVTDENGEIVALDAAGYGAVTVTKSISLIANPGFYAGISASTGNAVTLATAGKNLVLRGLNINGVGAANGINFTNGASLVVENCVISNFSTNGIVASSTSAATVRITNSTIRGTGGFQAAVNIQDNVTADISNTQVLNNSWVAIWAKPIDTGNASVSVSDSNVSGNGFGPTATGSTTNSRITVIRSTTSGNANWGVGIEGGWASVGYTLASANPYGFYNAGGTFQSLGNNLVRQNTVADTSGAITVVGGN